MIKKVLAAFLITSCTGFAGAQIGYPVKPIRVLVPYAPGGGADLMIRPVSQKLSEVLKQPILLDNRGGASGIIATDFVAKSVPDGYTLLFGTTSTQTVNPVLFAKVPYDASKDFAPITILALQPNALISSTKFGPRTIQELIAYAKANPEKVNYASSGSGVSVMYLQHLQQATGARMQLVSYKGAAPAFTAILAGEVDVLFTTVGAFSSALKDGRARTLAVGSLERLPNLPDVPTISESGVPGFESASWYGVLAPAGTPRPIISLLHDELVKILKLPEVANRYLAESAFPVGNSPENFAERMRNEMERWGRIAKAAGIKPVDF